MRRTAIWIVAKVSEPLLAIACTFAEPLGSEVVYSGNSHDYWEVDVDVGGAVAWSCLK